MTARDALDQLLAACKNMDYDAHAIGGLAEALVRDYFNGPQPDAWRPIDTYRPDEDDAYVLIAVPMEQHARPVVGEAKHHDDDGWWWVNNDPTDSWGVRLYPSHWMPLPAPPERTEG